jgi:hypothetical protein
MQTIHTSAARTLFLAALLALSTGSMAAGHSNAAQQFEASFWEIAVCPTADGYSEEIYLEGTYRVLAHAVDNGNHMMSTFQVFWEGTGYGMSSGAEYVLHGKWMEVVQVDPPFIFLWNDHFQLVGKGQADDFRIYWKIRFVQDANGDTVVDFEDVLQCETLEYGEN